MWDLSACQEALRTATTHAELWKVMDYVREVLDADAFSASRIQDGRPDRDSDHVLKMPSSALVEWYDDEACQSDPVMQHLKTSAEPIYWDEGTYVRAGQGEMWRRLSQVGLSQGAGAVLHMGSGHHFAMGFDWSDTVVRNERFRAEAMAATQFLILTAEAVSRKILSVEERERRAELLSSRETECLKLVACGKTAWEIAHILGISPHTANKHIESCVRKLGVSNRTHAATTAVRQGLL